MSLKVCIPSYSEAILSFKEGQVNGYAAPTFVELFDVFKKQFKNYTYTLYSDKYGDIVDHSEQRYDGCIGSLQQGLVDLALTPTNFPMIAPNVTNGAIISSSATTMVSGYNNSFWKAETDVMEFFTAFDYTLWLIIIFTLWILFSVQIVTIRIKRKRRSVREWSQNLLFSAALKQFSSLHLRTYRPSVRFVFFMIIGFVFQIHFFLVSMIKTEMVVQETPDTISTYSELLQHPECKPIWLKGTSTHWEFENSDPDSPAGRIWKNAVTSGLDKHFSDFDAEKMVSVFTSVYTRESMFFLPGYAVGAAATNLCAMSRGNGFYTDFNIWHRSDPASNERLINMLRSSNTTEELSRNLDVASQRVLEFGMFTKIVSSLEFIFAKDTGKSDVKYCMANRIIYPEHELNPIPLPHFSGLWKMLAFFLFLSSTVLLLEVFRLRFPKHSKKKCFACWS